MPFLGRSRHESADRWVVVGLGNPGSRYEKTRHNAGATVVAILSGRMGARLKRHKSGCLVAEGRLGGEPIVAARPTSHMNDSGRQVGQLARFYKTSPERLIVVHDELDVGFGQVRIKVGGGTAGHNGLGSIFDHLGTRDFIRVRVGIGRPRGRQEATGFVLSGFSASERKELPFLFEAAADAVERIVELGVERAMNDVNTRSG